MRQYMLRLAAQQQALDAAPAVRGHHDQIALVFFAAEIAASAARSDLDVTALTRKPLASAVVSTASPTT